MPFKPFLPLLILLIAALHSCSQRPLIPKDNSHALEAKNNLFVFVGKKMNFEELPYEKGSMAGGFRATYKILERVYGDYSADTIIFDAYDHYGTPAFEQYENVLLYVIEEDGKFYHEKYQFSPVYPTANNRWAGLYSRDHREQDSPIVKPEIIPFEKPVKFNTSRYFFNGMIFCDEKSFPAPYFRIAGDTAFAVYGNYVEELFKLKKEGVLRGRGRFGDTLTAFPEVQLEEIVIDDVKEPVDIKTERRFIEFANAFLKKLRARDTAFLARHMLDTLNICRRAVARSDFMTENRERIWDKRFMEEVIPEGTTSFLTGEIGGNSPFEEIKNKALRPRIMQVFLRNKKGGLINYSITLNFIETTGGYQLFGMEDEMNRACSGDEYDPYSDFT